MVSLNVFWKCIPNRYKIEIAQNYLKYYSMTVWFESVLKTFEKKN